MCERQGPLDDSVAIIVALQTGVGVEAIVQFDWMSEQRARNLLASFVANELGIEPTELTRGAAGRALALND